MQWYWPDLITPRNDPWTENNAKDWSGGKNMTTFPPDVSEDCIVGSHSIWMISDRPIVGGEEVKWYMQFPFPPINNDDHEAGELWPGLDGDGNMLPYLGPYGHFNAYGTNGLAEHMGQINAIEFYLKIREYGSGLDNAQTFRIEAIDGTHERLITDPTYQAEPNIIRLDSPTPVYKISMLEIGENIPEEINVGSFPGWNHVSIPFGPTVNLHDQPGSEKFDWSDIYQIYFCLVIKGSLGIGVEADIYFDGFRFVKPLWANVVSAYSGHKAVRKSSFYRNADIGAYSLLKLWAKGILLNYETPQVSVDFTNVGRVDLIPGQRFVLDNIDYVLREETIKLSKNEGWTIKGKGYAAT
jgi:hypothetical protein